jgi:hypothetical protein
MSQEELEKQFAFASAQVKSWPEWKQKILEISLSPTVAVARKPVDNFRAPDEPPPQRDK